MARSTQKRARPPAKSTRRPAKSTRKAAKGTRQAAKRARTPARRRVATRGADPLLAPLEGATRKEVAGVVIEVGRAGAGRVKRVVYPPGFHWLEHMKPTVGTDLCMHVHVGFLARGEIHVEYADGCVVEHKAPTVVAIDPGHDGWVVGDEPAVLIEFDFERDTANRLGMPSAHEHAGVQDALAETAPGSDRDPS